MTGIEEYSVAQLRELLKSAEETLFGLEFRTCQRRIETSPEETAFWIDQTLALRAQFRAEFEKRGEGLDVQSQEEEA
jgi:hypothetical protein